MFLLFFGFGWEFAHIFVVFWVWMGLVWLAMFVFVLFSSQVLFVSPTCTAS